MWILNICYVNSCLIGSHKSTMSTKRSTYHCVLVEKKKIFYMKESCLTDVGRELSQLGSTIKSFGFILKLSLSC